VDDFVKEPDIKQFFMKDIDGLLDIYQPGKPENKPDVMKQLEEIRIRREKQMVEQQQKMFMNNEQMQMMQQKMTEMSVIMQELTMENTILKNKNEYLENKISKLIQDLIDLKKSQLSK